MANSFAMSAPAGDTATLTVAGDWSIHQGLPSLGAVQKVLASPSPVRRITLQSPELRKWDSALLTFILSVKQLCGERGVAVDAAALPAGVRSLIELATAAPPRTGAAPERAAPSFVTRLGTATLQEGRNLAGSVTFLGECIAALISLVRGRARYRPADLFQTI